MYRTLLLACICLVSVAAQAIDDTYIKGYADALIERELQLEPRRVTVEGGVVSVDATGLGGRERQALRVVLRTVPGVTDVRLIDKLEDSEPAKAEPQITPPADVDDRSRQLILAPARLFDPLLADPRWPHFYASYHHYLQDDDLENVASVGFGETFSFFRQNLGGGRRYELGIQAGVFAIFDLDAPSTDLVNADYLVGPVATYRGGRLSATARFLHQSAHLGDEFVLRNPVERINYNYEKLDVLLSYDVTDELRIYGGAAYLVRVEPDNIDRFRVQYGAEFVGEDPILASFVRPIVALDLQHWEQTGFDVDFSARLGVELSDPQTVGNRLQVLLEYYNGTSPNGQFFDENIEYLGIGKHFYF